MNSAFIKNDAPDAPPVPAPVQPPPAPAPAREPETPQRETPRRIVPKPQTIPAPEREPCRLPGAIPGHPVCETQINLDAYRFEGAARVLIMSVRGTVGNAA